MTNLAIAFETIEEPEEMLSNGSLREDLEKEYRENYRLFISIAKTIAQCDQSTAEEIVQSVFINMFKKATEDNTPLEFLKAYLKRAVKNRALNYITYTQRRSILLRLAQKKRTGPLLDTHEIETPEQLASFKELIKRIETALQELPPSQAQALRILANDGDYEEIQKELGINKKGTVCSKVFRARELMRLIMEP